MNNEQTIDTVTNKIEVVDTVGLLKMLLSQEVVGQNVRIYLGARYDYQTPARIGGRWTLVDNYVFGKKPDDRNVFDYEEINESIPDGIRAKGVELKKKFVMPLTIELVMYRKVSKDYINIVAPKVAGETPYVITDDSAINVTHAPVELPEGVDVRVHHVHAYPLTLYKKK